MPHEAPAHCRCERAQRRIGRLSAALANATMPIPQLKVRSISLGADSADLGEPTENRGRREGREIERYSEIVGQDARQNVGKAAARDVGEREYALARRRSPPRSGFT